MGRKRISVGTSISRVIPDDRLPNSVKTGLTEALFRNVDPVDYVLEELVGSLGVKAEQMYTYGRDRYTHGLPSGQFTVAAEDIQEVMGTVLLSIENTAVEIDYLRYGAPNNLHIGWVKLIALHGYNPATNQLGGLAATKGTPVYLDDMVVVVPLAELDTIEAQSIQQWGIAARAGYTPERVGISDATRALIQPTPIQGDEVGTTEYLRVEYIWQGVAGLERDSLTIPITGYDDQSDYFHVRYQVGGVVKYWMYREDAGTYPTLDTLFDHDPVSNGSFFPFAYFRYDGVSEISNTSTAAYRTSKRLVKYLGMDYDSVAAGIDSNPGINDVRQAILMFVVPATTTNALEQRYLWQFFNNMYLASSPEHRYRSEKEAALAAANNEQTGLASPGIVIQDTRFKMSLDNLGVYKRRKAGNIGPKGSYSSATGTQTFTFQVYGTTDNNEVSELIVPVVSHYYRQQISAGFYDEIQVVSLRTVFYIYGDNIAIGDGEDPILIVPLDLSITSDFSIAQREQLYARAMHFVFNSVVITNVKWYQTGFFADLLLIVAVVITIISFGNGYPLIAAALAASEYAVAAYLVLKIIVVALVEMELFKLFVKAVGLEAAFVVAVIAALAGIASSNGFGLGGIAGMPTAEQLLAFSTGLSKAINASIQVNMADLLGEATQFEAWVKEQTKVLDTAKELLETTSILSPFVIMGENPQDFYNRTIRSGNIGVVGLSGISLYVEQALKLPELQDTLGD